MQALLSDPLSQNVLVLAVLAAACALIFQVFLTLYTLICLRLAAKDRHKLHVELHGLVRKIEGMTANQREQLNTRFESVLEALATRLPTTIAAKAGDAIFETEKRILSRLTELEPVVADDEVQKEKLEKLVCSMENLEQTVVTLTSDTVSQVLHESRRDFLEAADDVVIPTQ